MSRAATVLCLLALAGCAAPLQSMEQKHLTLTAADGTSLAASRWDSNSPVGILVLHMLGRDRHDYDLFAQRFHKKGFAVMSIDFRGHGESGGTKWQEMTPDEYRAMLTDAEAAAAELEEKHEDIVVVGASIGANIALQLAKTDPHVAGAVLLSPGRDYRSVKADASDTPVPILIIAAEDDQYSAESSRTLEEQGGGRSSLIMLEKAGHGTRMFDAQPDLQDTIIAWVEALS